MKNNKFLQIVILSLLAVVASSCAASVDPTPTVDQNAAMTQVAMTVAVEMTQFALQNPLPPTATLPPPATSTPQPTVQSDLQNVPASSPAAPVVVPTQAANASTPDNLAWVADVSVPDGTVFYRNEGFTKIWRVQNTGTTTWDSSYSLVNIDGNTWGADVVIPLTDTVGPGASIDLKIYLRAPNQTGMAFSRWKLLNSKGEIFGQELYVYITVGTKTPTPGVAG